ncbi:MAG: BCCT family transporter [Pseudomonadota bacterium]
MSEPEHDIDYETDYEVGQDNVEWLGLDIHNPVFFLAAGLILTFCLGALAFPEFASVALTGARDWTIQTFDWFYVITVNLVFLFCLALAVSPVGRIRLGGQAARPDFSTRSWLAMLFAAGVGIGMVFYGAAEPLAYYTDWAGTPLSVAAGTPEAERMAYAATIFHWGVTPWAVYAVVGLALAFFTFNKGLPLTIRSAFYPLLGDRVWGWPGHFIDLIAVIATLFGLATSLGLGARQAASGLEFLFGIEATVVSQTLIICLITSLAIVSVVRGLDGGVKVLSNINIALAIAVLAYIIIVGPTAEILRGFGTNAVAYIAQTPALSSWVGRPDNDWFHDWTIFYWAWWISWSPFVGMFIARVSKGRTIREFLAAVLLVPVVVVTIWFTAFGVTAIEQVKAGVGQLPGGIEDVSLVLFQMLENLPFAEVVSFVASLLLLVFFVTSSDSGSLVIDSITAGGKLHAPVPQRVFWASMEGLVAIVLLVGGGATALSTLQAGAIAAGLPFAAVLLVCCVSLYLGLRAEGSNAGAPAVDMKPAQVQDEIA